MNRWSSRKDPLATWRASVGADPDRALAWAHRVLEAGEAHAVYLSREAMRGEPERELLRGWWLSHYDHAAKRYPAGARIAIHGPDGAPVERVVDDLGALSRSLRSELPEDEHPLDFRCRPPVSIITSHARGRHAIDIELHSDLWMPWVWGFLEAEDRFPDAPPFDNRDLARLHTPRLDAFLADVRAASDAFEVRTEDCGQPFYYAWCVSEAGIDLSATPHAGGGSIAQR